MEIIFITFNIQNIVITSSILSGRGIKNRRTKRGEVTSYLLNASRSQLGFKTRSEASSFQKRRKIGGEKRGWSATHRAPPPPHLPLERAH